jgi:hypothetical protein
MISLVLSFKRLVLLDFKLLWGFMLKITLNLMMDDWNSIWYATYVFGFKSIVSY